MKIFDKKTGYDTIKKQTDGRSVFLGGVLKKSEKNFKEKILQAAQKLFFSRGYQKTSVADILKEVGISKGGFYHYFGGKEDLLDELADLHIQKHVARWREICAREDWGAIQKMRAVFRESTLIKSHHRKMLFEMVQVYYRSDNLLLRNRLEKKNMEVMVRELSPIVEQGIREGVFDTPFPKEVFKVLSFLFNSFSEEISDLFLKYEETSDKKLLDRMRALYLEMDHYFCRILGVDSHKIQFIDSDLTDLFFGENS